MLHISNKNIPLLVAKLFSRSVFNDIICAKHNDLVEYLIQNVNLPKSKDHSLFNYFEEFFKILSKSYRNEYVFKNSLAINIIKKEYCYNNVSYVNELRTNNSICDVAIFNNTSTAYEIKTNLDNFNRLPLQLMDYQTVFDRIYVICDVSKISIVEKLVSRNIGICALTDENKIILIKEALTNIDNISNKSIFYCLRPSEIEKIFMEKLNYSLPKRPKERRIESLAIFESLDKSVVNQYFIEYMRKRSLKDYEKYCFDKFPNSILAMLLNLRLNKKRLMDFNNRICLPLKYFYSRYAGDIINE